MFIRQPFYDIGFGLNAFKRLVKIGEDIVDMLAADGKPDRARGDVLLGEFLVIELTVRRRGRMDDEALHIRDVGKEGEDLQIVAELLRSLAPSLNLDGEDRRAAIGEIALIQRVVRMIRQGGMVNLADLFMNARRCPRRARWGG